MTTETTPKAGFEAGELNIMPNIAPDIIPLPCGLSKETLSMLHQAALLPDNHGILLDRPTAIQIMKALKLEVPPWEKKQ